jgi:integrase
MPGLGPHPDDTDPDERCFDPQQRPRLTRQRKAGSHSTGALAYSRGTVALAKRNMHDTRLAEIYQVTSTTGNDPELDTLLLRIHVETACRRGGALALRPMDLDVQQCLIRLREKGGTQRWQPVSPTLMAHLHHHAHQRRAPAQGQLLRYRTGQPLTSRRYDHLWQRLGEHLTWVAAQQVSAHWLRHTTLTWVERTFGHAVARAYAGHSGVDRYDTTAGYTRATLAEVATALATLTGEPHPLAPPNGPNAELIDPTETGRPE